MCLFRRSFLDDNFSTIQYCPRGGVGGGVEKRRGRVIITESKQLTRNISIPIVLKLRIVIYMYKPSIGILIREFE